MTKCHPTLHTQGLASERCHRHCPTTSSIIWRGLVKSFIDRKGELAQQLATLPRYHAYVQTHDEQGVPQEGVVRLNPPEPPTEKRKPDMNVIEAIGEISKEFTRKWEEIEKDINERQALARQTAQKTPPAKKTPEEPEAHPLVNRSGIYYPQ